MCAMSFKTSLIGLGIAVLIVLYFAWVSATEIEYITGIITVFFVMWLGARWGDIDR
jgi:hypothetical protein